jgi:hypothetical protein
MSFGKNCLILSFLFLAPIVHLDANDSCLGLINSALSKKNPFYSLPEFELMGMVEDLEKQANILRRLKDSPTPAIVLQIDAKLAKQDAYLMSEDYEIGIREWRSLFREVEYGHVIVTKNTEALAVLSKLSEEATKDEIILALRSSNLGEGYRSLIIDLYNKRGTGLKGLRGALEVENKKRLMRFGSLYQEYSQSRWHLENLLKSDSSCDNACKVELRKMLDKLGLGSKTEHSRFSRIAEDATRPSMEEMAEFLNRHPLALVARLTKERNAEAFALARDFVLQPYFLNKIFKGLYSMPGLNKTRLVRLFSFIYDYQARILHFPDINQVVRSTKTAADKLQLLMELNTTAEGDEILITFARRIDKRARDTWREVSTLAQTTESDFHTRMLKAEVVAKARGQISLVHDQSFVAKLSAVIFSGGGLGYYYMTDSGSVLIDQSDNIAEEGIAASESISIEATSEEAKTVDELATFMEINAEQLEQDKKQAERRKPHRRR